MTWVPGYDRLYNEPPGGRVVAGVIGAQQKAIMQDVKYDNPIIPQRDGDMVTPWLNLKPHPVSVSMVPRIMATPQEILAAREAQRRAPKKGG